jgi:hypothetical protein
LLLSCAQERGCPMLDVGDMLRWFKRVCVPRYVAGHEQFGPAERTDCPRYWLQHAVEEAVDLCFYLRQVEHAVRQPHDGLPWRIYIAGPYRADTPHQIIEHIETARDAMAALLRAGHMPFCPHSMTARFERDYQDIGEDCYLQLGIVWLRQCQGVLVLPGWEQSEGTLAEVAEAHRLGMPLWYSVEDVPSVASLASGGAVCNPGGSEENGG